MRIDRELLRDKERMLANSHIGASFHMNDLGDIKPPILDEGTKLDTGKPRMDLIPPEMLDEISKVLTFGAKKYEDRNWEKGMDWGRVYGALLRHLNAWWGNVNDGIDEETGFSHLSHALCCIAFLSTYEIRGIGKDTRSKKG